MAPEGTFVHNPLRSKTACNLKYQIHRQRRDIQMLNKNRDIEHDVERDPNKD